MIVAENITLYMGQRLVLNKVSANIPLGKVTAIIGPNGAGKSSLLKCLTGLLPIHQDGTITLNQKPLSTYTLAELSRIRAVLSQLMPVSFPFTVEEIVQMGRTPFDEQSKDLILYALSLVDGLHLMNRVFPTLSGGEQQRVQLARVILQIWGGNNRYLFLDEPTSALDLKHQHQVFKLVKELAKDYQLGVCVVIHDLHLTKRYADHVLLMKDGKIYAHGDVDTVLSKNNIETVFEVPADVV